MVSFLSKTEIHKKLAFIIYCIIRYEIAAELWLPVVYSSPKNSPGGQRFFLTCFYPVVPMALAMALTEINSWCSISSRFF